MWLIVDQIWLNTRNAKLIYVIFGLSNVAYLCSDLTPRQVIFTCYYCICLKYLICIRVWYWAELSILWEYWYMCGVWAACRVVMLASSGYQWPWELFPTHSLPWYVDFTLNVRIAAVCLAWSLSWLLPSPVVVMFLGWVIVRITAQWLEFSNCLMPFPCVCLRSICYCYCLI